MKPDEDRRRNLNLLKTPVDLTVEGRKKYPYQGLSPLKLAIAIGNIDIFEYTCGVMGTEALALTKEQSPNPLEFAIDCKNTAIIESLLETDRRMNMVFSPLIIVHL